MFGFFLVGPVEKDQLWRRFQVKQFVFVFGQVENRRDEFVFELVLVPDCKCLNHILEFCVGLWVLGVDEKHQDGVIWLLVNLGNK